MPLTAYLPAPIQFPADVSSPQDKPALRQHSLPQGSISLPQGSIRMID
jgi:hypothetical protein